MPQHRPSRDTGRIIVRLSDDVVKRLVEHPDSASFEDLVGVAAVMQLEDLRRRLEAPELADARTHRLVEARTIAEIIALEQRVLGHWIPGTPTLVAYWVIDARQVRERHGLIRDLNSSAISSVALAYPEPRLKESAVVLNPHRDQQGYRTPAPDGVNADYAYAAGFDGAGIGFVDIELSWNFYHEDLVERTVKASLAGPPVTPLFHNLNGLIFDGDCPEHGTNVLGTVFGVDNELGILGIAPGVTKVGVASPVTSTDPWDDSDIAGALIEAIWPDKGHLEWGDILLLELATNEDYPLEAVEHLHLLIRLAVDLGIVVIEPAGNGGHNLDTLPALTAGYVASAGSDVSWIMPLDRSSEAFVDTGAIMVGAAHPEVVWQAGVPVHLPYLDPYDLWASCFGSRVDCYAWGDGVYTTGGYDPTGSTCNQQYNPSFNGTSAASAILAGVALVTQQMAESSLGFRVSPTQMRAILTNPLTGTGYGLVNGEDRPIGVMPDLKKIAMNTLAAVPDVYIRDSVEDTGEQPAAAVFQSPDVMIRNYELAAASDWPDHLVANDPVLPDQDNFVYVRMRNRGTGSAEATVAVYWSEVSSLLTPDLWREIGRTDPISVPTGGEPVVPAPLRWTASAENRPAGDHGCLVAVADSPDDPAPPEITDADLEEFGESFWDRFLGYVGSNNNVAWRNFNVVATNIESGSAAAEWLLTGAPDRTRAFDLVIERPFHPDVELWWDLPRSTARLLLAMSEGRHFSAQRELPPVAEEPYEIALRLRPAATVLIRRVRLGRRSRLPCRFRVKWSDHRETGVYPVVLRQLHEGIEVGRVAWEFRVVRRKEPDERKS